MPQEPLKSMKKNTRTHDLPTVTVTSKLDPKLKAYQDSLKLYNISNKVKNLLENKYAGRQWSDIRKSNWVHDVPLNDELYNARKNSKIQPINNLPYDFTEDETHKLIIGKNIHNNLYINGKPASFGSVPIYKKPTQPVKYQKPQDIPVETIKKDIPSTPLSLMKKPEVVVQKQNNYDEGESIMLPIPSKLGGGGGAFIGTKKKDGTIEYVKPEDFKRMGVPPYGQEFILNKLAQEKK